MAKLLAKLIEPFRKLHARIADKQKWPRKWWWPASNPFDGEGWKEQWKNEHDDISKTIRRTMLALLGFSAFCILTLLTPDVESVTNMIRVPFVNTGINFKGFIIAGPLMLLSLLIYLHIFLGHLPHVQEAVNQRTLPYLFNLSGRAPRVLSGFIFYWLASLILLGFLYKASALVDAAYFLPVPCLVQTILLGLRVRRWDQSQAERRRPSYRFLFALVVVALLASVGSSFYALRTHSPLLRRLDLSGIDLRDYNLKVADLRRADMTGAILIEMDLSREDLSQAILTNADLSQAILQGTDLLGAELERAKLNDANLEGAKLINANLEGAKLKRAKLKGVNLNIAMLKGADLYDADLTEAMLIRADLTGAILTEASLYRAILADANLAGATFFNTDLREADLSRADFKEANLRAAILGGADLTEADFTNSSLIGTDLGGANLKGAVFVGADLTEADFTNAKNLTCSQLMSGKNWEKAIHDLDCKP